MKSIDDFLPWVTPSVIGAPEPMIKQYVLDACIDFCERTTLVQTVETQDVVAGTAEYEVFTPSQQRLVRVVSAFYNDTPLLPISVDEVRRGSAARAAVDALVASTDGAPSYFYQTTPTSEMVYLWPKPSVAADEGLAVRAAFAPLRTARQVEDVLVEKYARVIALGALARLLSVPAQTFANDALSKTYETKYLAECAAAAVTARRGLTRGSLRVQPRAFA